VLCDISGLSEWDGDEEEGREKDTLYFGEHAALPEKVMEWSGVKDSHARPALLFTEGLTHLNDSGKSFEEIADFIEENWEGL
jgi:hypothetical protein